jgi:GNAT superfamily N-acetyltransferase
MIDYDTIAEWNEELWTKAELIYNQAFPAEGRKTRAIIQRMFEKRMCQLHLATEGAETIAMALTGVNDQAHVVILDYIAIREDLRGNGYGGLFMDYIKKWAETTSACLAIVLEVEAEPTPDNIRRIHFWEKCGFRLTEYVHHYIWVPEPYDAMYLNFNQDNYLTADGEKLFHYITQFHKKAYGK